MALFFVFGCFVKVAKRPFLKLDGFLVVFGLFYSILHPLPALQYKQSGKGAVTPPTFTQKTNMKSCRGSCLVKGLDWWEKGSMLKPNRGI